MNDALPVVSTNFPAVCTNVPPLMMMFRLLVNMLKSLELDEKVRSWRRTVLDAYFLVKELEKEKGSGTED